jgi:hypothetical protein
MVIAMAGKLSTNMDDPEGRPYFLWDEDLCVKQVREILRGEDRMTKVRLLAKIMREARDDEVWAFCTVDEVVSLWPEISGRLGRRRAFWEFLIDGWKRQKLIA